jgi:hypothetical protein
MSCDHVQELISPLLDRRVAGAEREKALAHLGACRECEEQFKATANQRGALLGMASPPIPAQLSARLRVMASHELTRQLAHATVGSRLKYWYGRMQLSFDNMMRPFALPFAGGILSALIIFSILVPSLSFEHNFTDQTFFAYPDGQVVVAASTGEYMRGERDNSPRLERVDAVVPDDANVVTLTVDENGNVSDFAVARGKLTQDLTNIIMFSKFKPATFLGVPVSSKVNAVQRPLARHLRS